MARRILDSLTPGWQQIGAVWLPLPHLLNMLPVQVDALVSHRRVRRRDLGPVDGAGGRIARVDPAAHDRLRRRRAAPAPSLLLLNPNVLYLQSTPMTEPLLFGLTLFSIAATAAWVDGTAPDRSRSTDRHHGGTGARRSPARA